MGLGSKNCPANQLLARKALTVCSAEEIFEVAGFYLLHGQQLLDRRQFEYCSQDCGQCPVAEQDPVVEYQVLEFAAFEGHDHGSVGTVLRGNNPL